jgi:signal transduction histidine kinase
MADAPVVPASFDLAASQPAPLPGASADHLLQFYEREDFLYEVVADYLAQGLREGRPLITIATPEHEQGFVHTLEKRGVDTKAVRAAGRWITADARETLGLFLVNSMPDERLFLAHVGGLVERVLRATGATAVHAYGEMVDVLCRDGHPAAAMRLEDLWNGLAVRHSFALLCAYWMGNFESQEEAALFAETCRRHGAVSPAETFDVGADSDTRARRIAELQQRTRALEKELERRRSLDARLRKAVASQQEAEDALRRSQIELQAELAAVGRLHQMSLRLSGTLDLRTVLDDVLATAAALSDTDMGLVSLCGEDDRHLELGSSLGFPEAVLDHVRRVPAGGGACGTALEQRRRIVVEDIEDDPLFAAYRHVARQAGFRAVHSTPLLTRDDRIIGVLSVHFRAPRRPSDHEMRLLDLCARQAADYVGSVRLYERLRDNDRRKDEFLAMLAHELRNPLAPLQNAVEILRSDGGAGRTEYAAGVFSRQVRQMSRLVDDLLDLSRLTTGRIELKRTRVAVRELIGTALEMSRPLIDGGGQELVVSMPPASAFVDGDLTRLAQVVTNLLNNAAKYTDRGGRIVLSAERRAEDVVISVRDNGIGIPADKLGAIFEMFTRIGGARESAQGGLGIGLTLARRLVEMHGGRIEAQSDGPGQGSVFTVSLPPAAVRDGERPTRERTADPHVGSLRVLVVDDNVDSADTMSMVLELKGAVTRTARDGHLALEAAAEFRPDVILLDIGLPGMNGHEVARTLRRQPHGRDVLLVAVSGWGQDSDRRASLDAGFDRHLTKPVDHGVLGELLAGLGPSARRRGGA